MRDDSAENVTHTDIPTAFALALGSHRYFGRWGNETLACKLIQADDTDDGFLNAA